MKPFEELIGRPEVDPRVAEGLTRRVVERSRRLGRSHKRFERRLGPRLTRLSRLPL